ncbi:S1C family serine protease [Marinitoga sp. 1137]|uniref:S1C family serine protease n=1 Tax=Marinitoga sp. 1137 TaxID=1545835 RepID=UPI000951AFA9|nr:trypsin-like peptidase domain-containing protein [Marinitoga sp. 1137]
MKKSFFLLFIVLLIFSIFSFGDIKILNISMEDRDELFYYAPIVTNNYIILASPGTPDKDYNDAGIYLLDKENLEILDVFKTYSPVSIVSGECFYPGYFSTYYAYYDNTLISFYVSDSEKISVEWKKSFEYKDIEITNDFDNDFIIKENKLNARKNDIIIKINDEYLYNYSDMAKYLENYSEDVATLHLLRNNSNISYVYKTNIVTKPDYIISGVIYRDEFDFSDNLFIQTEKYIYQLDYEGNIINRYYAEKKSHKLPPTFSDLNQDGKIEVVFFEDNYIKILDNGNLIKIDFDYWYQDEEDIFAPISTVYYADVDNDYYPEGVFVDKNFTINYIEYDPTTKSYYISYSELPNKGNYKYPLVSGNVVYDFNFTGDLLTLITYNKEIYMLSSNEKIISKKILKFPIISRPYIYWKNGWFIVLTQYDFDNEKTFLTKLKYKDEKFEIIDTYEYNGFYLLEGYIPYNDNIYALLCSSENTILQYIEKDGTEIFEAYETYMSNNNNFIDYIQTFKKHDLKNKLLIAESGEEIISPEEIAKKMESVVRINNYVYSSDEELEASGSGFIIAEDDFYYYIATNAHVVSTIGEDITKDISYYGLSITFFNGETVSPEEVFINTTFKDIAILSISKFYLDNTYPVLPLGLYSHTIGTKVYALGNPKGLDFSFTQGIISAIRFARINEAYKINNDKFFELIQTDTAINHGNSGGPLVDKYGNVIGINSLGGDKNITEGLNFAISANDLYYEIKKDNFIKLFYDSRLPNDWLFKTLKNKFSKYYNY